MMGGVRLVGGRLDDTDCLPSDLKSPSSACLTFDLGVDLSSDLALVVGADGVPQIPVPQPCSHTETNNNNVGGPKVCRFRWDSSRCVLLCPQQVASHPVEKLPAAEGALLQ